MKSLLSSLRWIAAIAIVIAIGVIAGCERGAPEQEEVAPAALATEATVAVSAWLRFTDEFVERYFDVLPTAAVWAGLHEYDGRLPDVSAQSIQQRADMLREYAHRAQEEFSGEALTAGEELQRQHLIAAIEGMLFSVEVAEYHRHNPAWYAGTLSPSVYVSRDYAPKDVRLKALTAYLQKVPAYLEQMRDTLQPPFARPFVRTALVRFGGLASHLQNDAPALFAEVTDDELQAAFGEAQGPAVAALRDVEAWLQLRLEDAAGDFALGEARYRELLRRAYRIDLDWQALKDVAEADLDRNLELLRTTCALVDPEISIADCAARVRDDKPEAGAVARANEQLPELKTHLLAANIIGIPSEETAFVAEAPAYRRHQFGLYRDSRPL